MADADPWAQFVKPNLAPNEPADPWAQFVKPAPEPEPTSRPSQLLSEAASPITGLPSTYDTMVRDARGAMSEGVDTIRKGGIGNVAKGAAETALGAVDYAGAPIAAPIRTIVGEPTRKLVEYETGSETAGKLAGESAEIGASFFVPIPKGLSTEQRAAKAVAKEATTIESIKKAAVAGFESPEIDALVFDPKAIQQWSYLTRLKLNDMGIDENLAPKTMKIIEKLDNPPAGSTVTGKGVASLRRTLGKAAGQPDPTERMAATHAIESLDHAIANMPDSALLSGDAKKAADTWAKARANYTAAKHAELVQEAAKKAKNKTGSMFSGLNFDNVMRQRVNKILDDPKARRGFTDEQIAQMEKIVKGTWTGNVPRFIGNLLGGGGGFQTVLAASGGAAAAGPIGAAAPLVGYAFKKLGNLVTSKNVSDLDKMIRSGSPQAQEVTAGMNAYGQAATAAQANPTAENLARLTIASNALTSVLYQNGIMVKPQDLMKTDGRQNSP